MGVLPIESFRGGNITRFGRAGKRAAPSSRVIAIAGWSGQPAATAMARKKSLAS